LTKKSSASKKTARQVEYSQLFMIEYQVAWMFKKNSIANRGEIANIQRVACRLGVRRDGPTPKLTVGLVNAAGGWACAMGALGLASPEHAGVISAAEVTQT
jgi:hypothetical protein